MWSETVKTGETFHLRFVSEQKLVFSHTSDADHLCVRAVRRWTRSALQTKMSTVEPVLADHALDHLVGLGILRVRIGSGADAINASEILVVPTTQRKK